MSGEQIEDEGMMVQWSPALWLQCDPSPRPDVNTNLTFCNANECRARWWAVGAALRKRGEGPLGREITKFSKHAGAWQQVSEHNTEFFNRNYVLPLWEFEARLWGVLNPPARSLETWFEEALFWTRATSGARIFALIATFVDQRSWMQVGITDFSVRMTGFWD